MNTASEKQVATASRKAKRQREADLADLRAVAATPGGVRVLRRILERCGVYKLSYAPDAGATAFNEGMRNIGLWILSEVEESAPEQIVALLTLRKSQDSVE